MKKIEEEWKKMMKNGKVEEEWNKMRKNGIK